MWLKVRYSSFCLSGTLWNHHVFSFFSSVYVFSVWGIFIQFYVPRKNKMVRWFYYVLGHNLLIYFLLIQISTWHRFLSSFFLFSKRTVRKTPFEWSSFRVLHVIFSDRIFENSILLASWNVGPCPTRAPAPRSTMNTDSNPVGRHKRMHRNL